MRAFFPARRAAHVRGMRFATLIIDRGATWPCSHFETNLQHEALGHDELE